MLDPLATFLMRVLAAGNDVDPVAALFSMPGEITADQRAMAEELARRAHEQGYIDNSDAADGNPARVSVTTQGRQYLDDLDL